MDAMEMLRSARPRPSPNGDIRPLSAGEVNGRPLDELSTTPASPLYRSKVPPPPCFACGEDHVPGRTYTHEWQPEPPVEQAQNTELFKQMTEANGFAPLAPVPAMAPAQRVAVYVGRGDKYVVAVECSPDWDSTETFKVDPQGVMPLVKMARALGVKVQDKTGGDLVELETDAG